MKTLLLLLFVSAVFAAEFEITAQIGTQEVDVDYIETLETVEVYSTEETEVLK